MGSQTGLNADPDFTPDSVVNPPPPGPPGQSATNSPETRCDADAVPMAGLTLLAHLRARHPEFSWSACRKLLADRRVRVNDVLEIHEARRLKSTDLVTVAGTGSRPLRSNQIAVVFADRDLVVVEKPPHLVTTRRPEERRWSAAKRALAPTLDELTAAALAPPAPPRSRSPQKPRHPSDPPRLFRVQRLDRETSGLVVFARHQAAADKLIEQFAARSVERTYWAVVLGHPPSQTISTRLVRDRGDGLRGSTRDGKSGQSAVTHVTHLRSVGPVSLIECRLETGRTHQIRIHLAEINTPVCGDPVYHAPCGQKPTQDNSGAPRLALHAARLGFQHPLSGQALRFESAWPPDLASWSTANFPGLVD